MAVVIDWRVYPHIVDAILEAAAPELLLTFRGTCEHFRARIDSSRLQHVGFGQQSHNKHYSLETATHLVDGLYPVLQLAPLTLLLWDDCTPWPKRLQSVNVVDTFDQCPIPRNIVAAMNDSRRTSTAVPTYANANDHMADPAALGPSLSNVAMVRRALGQFATLPAQTYVDFVAYDQITRAQVQCGVRGPSPATREWIINVQYHPAAHAPRIVIGDPRRVTKIVIIFTNIVDFFDQRSDPALVSPPMQRGPSHLAEGPINLITVGPHSNANPPPSVTMVGVHDVPYHLLGFPRQPTYEGIASFYNHATGRNTPGTSIEFLSHEQYRSRVGEEAYLLSLMFIIYGRYLSDES